MGIRDGKPESVENLRYWVIQEAEFQTIAAETTRGLTLKDSGKSSDSKKRHSQFTNFSNDTKNDPNRRSLKISLFVNNVEVYMVYGNAMTLRNFTLQSDGILQNNSDYVSIV